MEPPQQQPQQQQLARAPSRSPPSSAQDGNAAADSVSRAGSSSSSCGACCGLQTALSSPVLKAVRTVPADKAAALENLIRGSWAPNAIYCLCRLGVPDALGAAPAAALSPAELASRLHCSAPCLRRLLRLCAAYGLLVECASRGEGGGGWGGGEGGGGSGEGGKGGEGGEGGKQTRGDVGGVGGGGLTDGSQAEAGDVRAGAGKGEREEGEGRGVEEEGEQVERTASGGSGTSSSCTGASSSGGSSSSAGTAAATAATRSSSGSSADCGSSTATAAATAAATAIAAGASPAAATAGAAATCLEARTFFYLTDIGTMLQSSHPSCMHWLALMLGLPGHYVSRGHLYDNVKQGRMGFETAFGCDWYTYVSHHSFERRAFDAAMTATSTAAAQAVAAGYDFSRHGTVMDVGGGQGLLMAAILHTHSGVRAGYVMEVPGVVAAARRLGQRGMERLRYVEGDFFQPFPRPADGSPLECVVMRLVLHDWPDAEAAQILRHARKALLAPPTHHAAAAASEEEAAAADEVEAEEEEEPASGAAPTTAATAAAPTAAAAATAAEALLLLRRLLVVEAVLPELVTPPAVAADPAAPAAAVAAADGGCSIIGDGGDGGAAATADLVQRLEFDMGMMLMTQGRERSLSEWRQLLRAGGFELQQVVMTGGDGSSNGSGRSSSSGGSSGSSTAGSSGGSGGGSGGSGSGSSSGGECGSSSAARMPRLPVLVARPLLGRELGEEGE
ncbi:hypothetical protein CHLRE_08g365800v5 [Chlamydomonas reinhardtii]|uniref:Uncharacterized protein n=1 Tax=Chlamydomonas reinhardtii TaxID=3055 RepID=A0A2K3DGX3_CHLRE|nr:uncharacterized protein CHLRE_08g365800v5 [Chlamydomonas reinhardtii]PNW79766.1 hypothetical protein CHLRE_08g365800v5 [Chlamydomonas reinhardtii]